MVPLTQGHKAMVDEDDYEKVMKYKWYAHFSKNEFIYARHKGKSESFMLHNFILGCKGVDHIDRNGLNCQRFNLRIATSSQQSANRVLPRKNEFIGVWKNNDKWSASLRCNGIRYYAGAFNEIKDAAKAYDEMAKKYHGEFAVLNFPESK